VAGLVGEREQALGIRQQGLAGGGEHQPAAIADEQFRAELLFELLDTRGHVRLHAVQLRGGTRDAVFAHYRAKNRKGGQIHDSL
jgi:hypothetical protein